MNLTRNLYLLFLCGMCTPAVHAAGNMTTDAAVQQTVNQDADATMQSSRAFLPKLMSGSVLAEAIALPSNGV